MQWQVDFDYTKQLSAKDAAWLSKFADEYHRGSFWDEPIHDTDELRKDCYRRKNWANVDAYGISAAGHALDSFEDQHEATPKDESAPPEYLDSAEYKRARELYRRHLPTNDKAKPEITPAMKAARTRLEHAKKKDSSDDKSS